MFCKNLKQLRKQKGFSQEELAKRLGVVRQTISKWEKGLSVPDAELLVKLADILEVTAAELLGEPIQPNEDRRELAERLARINEQLAIKNRRSHLLWMIVLWVLLGFILLHIFVLVIGVISNNSFQVHTKMEVQQIPADASLEYLEEKN